MQHFPSGNTGKPGRWCCGGTPSTRPLARVSALSVALSLEGDADTLCGFLQQLRQHPALPWGIKPIALATEQRDVRLGQLEVRHRCSPSELHSFLYWPRERATVGGQTSVVFLCCGSKVGVQGSLMTEACRRGVFCSKTEQLCKIWFPNLPEVFLRGEEAWE